jgi:hypothetical protein
VEGRGLSSRQMQDVAKDTEIGKPHMGSFGVKGENHLRIGRTP